MNLSTIEVSPAEAAAKLAEYEQSLRVERNAEDEAIAQAYRAAKRGLSIIRMSRAVDEGGYFPDGLPRIAIARADAERCWLSVRRSWNDQAVTFVYGDERWPDNRGALVGEHTVRVTTPGPRAVTNARSNASCVVPLVPPRHRPARRGRLHRLHVLWEVDEWTSEPPRDPALVRHLRGDLWSVLATWDLTDLERAILAGSR